MGTKYLHILAITYYQFVVFQRFSHLMYGLINLILRRFAAQILPQVLLSNIAVLINLLEKPEFCGLILPKAQPLSSSRCSHLLGHKKGGEFHPLLQIEYSTM